MDLSSLHTPSRPVHSFMRQTGQCFSSVVALEAWIVQRKHLPGLVLRGSSKWHKAPLLLNSGSRTHEKDEFYPHFTLIRNPVKLNSPNRPMWGLLAVKFEKTMKLNPSPCQILLLFSDLGESDGLPHISRPFE